MAYQSFFNFKQIVLFITAIIMASSIQIPLTDYTPRCMILQATFEPIKVQIKFPKIPNKMQDENFQIQIYQYLTAQKQFSQFFQQNSIYRKNFKLDHGKLYSICIQFVTSRDQLDEPIYIKFIATQDFQSLVGKIQIPKELQNQKNLKQIYTAAKKMTNLNKKIVEYQKKEREAQDKLTQLNLNKNQRIVSLTFLQCLIIVLSGIYQVFALRRFLIQKNLY